MLYSAKHIKLHQIASIRTGYSFRGKIDSIEDDRSIQVIQPKDLSGSFDPVHVDFDTIAQYKTHALKENDILIANKGVKFSNCLITDSLAGSVA
jgi:hypothetical protein